MSSVGCLSYSELVSICFWYIPERLRDLEEGGGAGEGDGGVQEPGDVLRESNGWLPAF